MNWSGKLNVLAFFAHPDDETMLVGGTLALLAMEGATVHYLCATRGEGGEVGDPPMCPVEHLGELRERELECAVQSLGGSSLSLLDYTDPRVGLEEELFAYTDNLTHLVGQVAANLRQFGTDVVITHGSNGEYGHPAHKLSNQAARLAVETFGAQAPLLYTVSAFFTAHPRPRLANRDDPAHLVIDITPALERKIQAALCYRSQHALFVRRSSLEAGRQLSVPEVIMHLESLHRAHPPANDLPEDTLAVSLRPWYLNHDK
jgi:LmbE family N-acetylglucosaminyl deacetylase